MTGSADFDQWSPQGPVEELSEESAWELLRFESFGRLAVADDNRPQIFPVDYCADGTDILFRTSAGTKLGDLIANDTVAFEVDSRSRDESWSVVITGIARVVTGAAEIAAANRAPLPSWIPVATYAYVKIAPSSLHGRRFVHSLAGR
jgi:nitroimidazol reductase NimA-like FMN-containing flavoprotein (pyridoxamine 5'-phosphate oxidase superfamily)